MRAVCLAAGILSVVSLVDVGVIALSAEPLPVVRGVDIQPLAAQVKRVTQALELLGSPLDREQQAALDKALANSKANEAAAQVQAVLDPLCLVAVNVNPESRVKVGPGPAAAKLMQQGWRLFLVKVHNEAGVTAQLKVASPNAEPLYTRSSGQADPKVTVKPSEVGDRWLDVSMYDKQPLNEKLSGLAVEYRIVQLYSRDVGKREAKLLFDVGQGTQDLGFRNELSVLFTCEPAVDVTLEVIDEDGSPTTAHFVVRDAKGRVYPSLARRLAPDFFFHNQIYRHSGESIMLPPGKYHVSYGRGPEYREQQREIDVPATISHKESFRLKRWIKLADMGWYSGDHHVHAAGCAHYESPSEGVQPGDMMRHILGEDLNVGCVLSWGPCWYFQKQYFEGKVHKLSLPTNLMRYDVEVSGFPSSHAGHLCLLQLKEDDYTYLSSVSFDWRYEGESGHFEGTKTDRIGQWPSWDLPVLQWGKQQGAIVGFSHSGWGLDAKADTLPNYEIPPFNGIGANEYIVDVVHGACDFISAVDTPILWELNIWYHTLNCGYTARISGETDFPCIYGERVGLGRAYVKLDKDQPLDYARWADGIRDGRSYCSDGLSHLIDFSVNGFEVGTKGAGDRPSVLAAKAGEKLVIRAKAAALLAEQPRDDIRRARLDHKPYWHVERARIDNSNAVPVELVVNGQSVETKQLTADGTIEDVTFEITPKKSSWVALRIFPSAHTNPVFVEVDGQPIRASKKSAQWCLNSVDACWQAKSGAIREHEKAQAAAAFDTARVAYRKILAESAAD